MGGTSGAVDRTTTGSLLDAKFHTPDTPSMARHRVLESIRAAAEHPAAVLIAPAGSGKTTALAGYVATLENQHAWYRVERTESEASRFLQHLEHALRTVVPDLEPGWDTVEAAAHALLGVTTRAPTYLVIDDLHELRDTPSVDALERLIGYLPRWLHVLAATRHGPGLNLPQLRLSGRLAEIPSDTLRWRPWEVERLFRDFYREPLPPEDAARLTQRTEGWVAGLQLFFLASRELPVARRSALIDQLHTRPGLVREYLTRNVVERLPDGLQEFLVDTCVLGRLEPGLCNELRDRSDSAAFLAELEERRLFTVPREDGNGYRYHEVLRAHLDHTLQERHGAMALRERYRRAGVLLEGVGATAEAVYAYARSECWTDAARLLGSDGGPRTREGDRRSFDLLPSWFVASDPWLQLARARAHVGEGRLPSAVAAYRRAEESFGTGPGATMCRRERVAVQAWLDPHERPSTTLTDVLRDAVRRDPGAAVDAATAVDTGAGLAVAAVAALLAGRIDDARRLARGAGGRADTEVLVLAAARVIEHLAALAAGQPADPADLLTAAATFEQLGLPWLARLARTLAGSQSDRPASEVEAYLSVLAVHEDPWGVPLTELTAGIASVLRGEPQIRWLDDAGARSRELGASTLAAWADAWRALGLATLGHVDAPSCATEARSVARSAGVPGAEAIAEAALAGATAGADAGARAIALARELGLALPPWSPPDGATRSASHMSCFGGLSLVLDGHPIDLDQLRPQARTALALLALQIGEPVHREALIDVLWPDDDVATGKRRLQVLISTLRRHLEPDAEPGAWTYLTRSGEAYVLRLPEPCEVDVVRFDEAIAAARRAHDAGDTPTERQALEVALRTYTGDLLPEAGPADWVIDERERHRTRFATVAQSLASLQAASGEHAACIETCLTGLSVDRYRSRLWTLLADAYRSAADPAAAARTDAEHAAVLAELGVGGSA